MASRPKLLTDEWLLQRQRGQQKKDSYCQVFDCVAVARSLIALLLLVAENTFLPHKVSAHRCESSTAGLSALVMPSEGVRGRGDGWAWNSFAFNQVLTPPERALASEGA